MWPGEREAVDYGSLEEATNWARFASAVYAVMPFDSDRQVSPLLPHPVTPKTSYSQEMQSHRSLMICLQLSPTKPSTLYQFSRGLAVFLLQDTVQGLSIFAFDLRCQ